MKKTLAILVALLAPTMSPATQQVPDKLLYDDLELSLSTGWGHPSPLGQTSQNTGDEPRLDRLYMKHQLHFASRG